MPTHQEKSVPFMQLVTPPPVYMHSRAGVKQAGWLGQRYKKKQNAGNLGGLEQVLTLFFKPVSLNLKCV